jgi:hypothetical protein
MRSEGEIRREVEERLRRWGLLALNGILWVGAAKLLYGFSRYSSFGRFDGVVVLAMVLWAALVGLHALRTFYVEGKEWLVRRAIEREREFYRLQTGYEKRKRDESASLPDDSRFSLPAEDGEYTVLPFRHEAEDGELVDFPFRFDTDKRSNDER